MHCPSCRALNRPERRYCHACAAPLSVAACTRCGFENHPGERFCGGCAAEVAAAAPRATEAERRQVTVLFCDMVGSTALSATLDAEDLRDLITRFQGTCASEVARFGGYVARYMGDGLLVYFGYPTALEDGAGRAVRAGLALVDAVARLDGDVQVRVGIATGRVVVGDLIGEGASAERAMVGETPNLAARLQALARPGTVVIAPATRRLVADAIEVEDLGEHVLKGFPEPVRAWRAVGVARARRSRVVTPLVGRAVELAVLRERWSAAVRGPGAVVAVVGDAGAGKTRLVDELAREVPEVVRFSCTSHQTTTALHPVADQLARAAGIELADAAELRAAKLRALVEGWSTEVDRDVEALSAVLGTGGSLDGLDPEGRRRAMLDATARYLRVRPRLVVFEDVQWADPTTLALLGSLVAAAPGGPGLLLLTWRSDFVPPWRGPSEVTRLALGQLGPLEARQLVRDVADGAIDPATVDAILARADGVPGFLVEVTRAVGWDGGLVPETLHDSLAAQLDRLGAVRALAQAAAVVGRDVPRELLARIAPSDRDLGADLDALVEAGVLVPPRDPSAPHAFRHALMRDVAYTSLLNRERRRLHDRIASALIDELPVAAEADPVATARHLTKAERAREASAWWARAARAAGRHASFAEAASHLGCAADLLASVADPGDAAACRTVAELRVELALSLRVVGRVDEAFAALDAAEAALGEHDEPEARSHLWFARGNLYFNSADVSACEAAHGRALELARRSGSALAEVRALGGLADAKLLGGRRVEGARAAAQCVEVALAHGFRPIAAANAGGAAFGFLLAMQLEEAARMAELAIEIGTAERLPRAVMVGCNALALARVELGELDAAERALELRDRTIPDDHATRLLVMVDHRVLRLRGEDAEARARAETALRDSGVREGWGVVMRALLVAELDGDARLAALDDVTESLARAAPHHVDWAVLSLIDGLMARAAWDALERVLARFSHLAEPRDRAPLITLWVDAGRAALGRARAPGDPTAEAEVARCAALAREQRAGSVVRALGGPR